MKYAGSSFFFGADLSNDKDIRINGSQLLDLAPNLLHRWTGGDERVPALNAFHARFFAYSLRPAFMKWLRNRREPIRRGRLCVPRN